jgi:hypothetical protein
MSYYRKKPVVIEAMNWDGSWDSMVTIKARWPEMRTTRLNSHTPSRKVLAWSIGTLEGPHEVSPGDYIIKGVKGEFYPCKSEIFHLTYESAEAQDPVGFNGLTEAETNATMSVRGLSDDVADARRYRWLRNHPLDGLEETTPCIRAAENDRSHWALHGDEADAVIDAAMKQGGEV